MIRTGEGQRGYRTVMTVSRRPSLSRNSQAAAAARAAAEQVAADAEATADKAAAGAKAAADSVKDGWNELVNNQK